LVHGRPVRALEYAVMDWDALAVAVVGSVLLAASFAGARRAEIGPGEQRVFRAVNRLPDWLYRPLWVPMQLGNLVVGTGVGLAVALVRRDGRLAAGVAVAVALKLVFERVIRHRMADSLRVRQRPGTSEPGAILRGADVPATGPSFPSGHVILVAGVATVLATGIALSWSWLPFVLVALVMLGRVYVGAHNPLDVTAGLGAGLVAGGIVALFLH
jgi:membrane-associated phospholipid phosphatase